MAVKSQIHDGKGGGHTAEVTSDNALLVATVPPRVSDRTPEQLTAIRLYRSYFRDKNGSSDLNVDGSGTVRKFKMVSTADSVFWLQGVRFLLNGSNLEINTNDFRRFGAAAIAPGLTNGLRFYAKQGGAEVNIFAEPVKMIGDFLNYCDDFTNLVNAVSAQSDFLSVDFNLDAPVAMPPATVDELTVEVRDDLTNIDLFRVIARGFQESL